MKIMFILFGLCFCFINCKPPTETTAEVIFSPSKLDFGVISQDSMFEGVVKVFNESNDTVQILKISAECGCTETSILKKVLAPNESTSLIVKYDPKHSEDSGLVSRDIGIRLTTKNPISVINIHGVVEK